MKISILLKKGVILLCQIILETKRISHLHGSDLFTIPLISSKNCWNLQKSTFVLHFHHFEPNWVWKQGLTNCAHGDERACKAVFACTKLRTRKSIKHLYRPTLRSETISNWKPFKIWWKMLFNSCWGGSHG